MPSRIQTVVHFLALHRCSTDPSCTPGNIVSGSSELASRLLTAALLPLGDSVVLLDARKVGNAPAGGALVEAGVWMDENFVLKA